jgi:hypothetical protein
MRLGKNGFASQVFSEVSPLRLGNMSNAAMGRVMSNWS